MDTLRANKSVLNYYRKYYTSLKSKIIFTRNRKLLFYIIIQISHLRHVTPIGCFINNPNIHYQKNSMRPLVELILKMFVYIINLSCL